MNATSLPCATCAGPSQVERVWSRWGEAASSSQGKGLEECRQSDIRCLSRGLAKRIKKRHWRLEVCMIGAATSGDQQWVRGFQKGNNSSFDTGSRELLAQGRRRKELEKMRKDQQESASDSDDQKVWPFWKKKKSPKFESKWLTKRIIELSRRRQLDQVFEVLAEARESGKPLNLITMNAVMAACVHCEDYDRMLQVYYEMIKPGNVGVDSVTYGTLLKGLGLAGRLDDAFEVLESMEAGTAPGRPEVTEVHVNTLMNACAEAGQALRARGVLHRLNGITGSPSTFSYNLLIKGYARSDNPLEALEVVDEMREQELPLQRLTYNSLILACVRGEDVSRAMEFLDEMKEQARVQRTSRLLPDVVTYTTLLKGVAEEGDIRAVRGLAAEMKEAPMCVLDRVAYSAIIDACITARYPEEGLRVLVEMEQRAQEEPELRPRAHTFLALMRALAEKGDVPTVRALGTRMQRDAAGRVWPEDIAEAQELVLEAAMTAGRVDLAQEALQEMSVIQKGRPISQKAMPFVVRLFALSSGAGFEKLQPQLLHPQVSMRMQASEVMRPISAVHPAASSMRVMDVQERLAHVPALPVVDEDARACIGVVLSSDCSQKDDAMLVEITQPLKAPLPMDSTVSEIAHAFMKPGVEVIAITNFNSTMLDLEEECQTVPSYPVAEDSSKEGVIVGFVFKEDIFDMGKKPWWLQSDADII